MRASKTKLQNAWLEAADALGIRVEAPSFFEDADSQRFEVSVRLPDFGGSSGLLLFGSTDSECASDAAYRDGEYSVSLLGVGAYEVFSRDHFVELLLDWGWSADGRAPSWYQTIKAEQDVPSNR